ncbi:hypothetical protein LCGC14_1679400 [marine sediment metagenome]|uniref:Uncharacterized protein n=1 Tax=marine sediment metagenome TaxID=412755 RepID=A0A0F9KP44_9ZZZZ
MAVRKSLDCYCGPDDGRCPVCVVAIATRLRHDHPETLSVSMLKRRIPGITGREAMFLVEMSRGLLRDGSYVTHSPAHG